MSGNDVAMGLDDPTWNWGRRLIESVHTLNIDRIRSSTDAQLASDLDAGLRWRHALRIMTFIVLSSTIQHRPFTDDDAVELADSLFPFPPQLRQFAFAEILDAVRVALVLKSGPGFDADNRDDARRLVGIWAAVVGLRITDVGQFDAMRDDVDRWLVRQGLAVVRQLEAESA